VAKEDADLKQQLISHCRAMMCDQPPLAPAKTVAVST